MVMKTSEELYRERTKRVQDAIELKVPDRVPFTPTYSFFPARYAGISCEEVMYDPEKLSQAYKKAVLDFEPDMYSSYANFTIGPMLEALRCRWLKWPGHGVSPNAGFQFVEGEHMKAEEYDEFLFDPTDFILRVFMPRAYGALEPLGELPPLPSLYYTRFLTGAAVFAGEAVSGAFQALLKSGKEAHRAMTRSAEFITEMAGLGYPCQFGGVAYAPFDYLGDLLRGTRGIMLDMYRLPDKLQQAMDKLIPYILRGAFGPAERSGIPRIFIPLHKGLDGFMSPEQFKTFYWPSLRKVILALIDGGLTPNVLWEGNCESRLETIRDIPRGKAVYAFERTNLFKAKEILGDRVCIRGNVPPSLLIMGSPQEVREYCTKVIRQVGKGGGLMMDGASGIPDETKPENLKAMEETTKEVGLYG